MCMNMYNYIRYCVHVNTTRTSTKAMSQVAEGRYDPLATADPSRSSHDGRQGMAWNAKTGGFQEKSVFDTMI